MRPTATAEVRSGGASVKKNKDWDTMEGGQTRPVLLAIETHYAELVTFVRRRVRCSALAADIVQETFVRLAASPQPATVDNPRAFLYRVAGNLAIDVLRQQRFRAKHVVGGWLPEDVADGRPLADKALAAKQRLACLGRAVDELPPRCRQVFLLRKVEGLDQAQIAQALGISRNMVEKHLRKALLHCAMRMDQSD